MTYDLARSLLTMVGPAISLSFVPTFPQLTPCRLILSRFRKAPRCVRRLSPPTRRSPACFPLPLARRYMHAAHARSLAGRRAPPPAPRLGLLASCRLITSASKRVVGGSGQACRSPCSNTQSVGVMSPQSPSNLSPIWNLNRCLFPLQIRKHRRGSSEPCSLAV